jgi:hypothetical protein
VFGAVENDDAIAEQAECEHGKLVSMEHLLEQPPVAWLSQREGELMSTSENCELYKP